MSKYSHFTPITGVIGYIVNLHDPLNYDIDLCGLDPSLRERYASIIQNTYSYQDENGEVQTGTTYRCRLKGIGIHQQKSVFYDKRNRRPQRVSAGSDTRPSNYNSHNDQVKHQTNLPHESHETHQPDEPHEPNEPHEPDEPNELPTDLSKSSAELTSFNQNSARGNSDSVDPEKTVAPTSHLRLRSTPRYSYAQTVSSRHLNPSKSIPIKSRDGPPEPERVPGSGPRLGQSYPGSGTRFGQSYPSSGTKRPGHFRALDPSMKPGMMKDNSFVKPFRPNRFKNKKVDHLIKEAHIAMIRQIDRQGGWVLCTISDCDVYNRILVTLYDPIMQTDLSSILLSEPYNKVFRPYNYIAPPNDSCSSVPLASPTDLDEV
jgi:hypothetical protein